MRVIHHCHIDALRRGSSSSQYVTFLVICSSVVLLQRTGVTAIRLPSIYWNSSNPIFKASTNDHVIEALLYDDIDFVCPYYELSAARDDGDVINVNEEYYLVYLVSQQEYDDCNAFHDYPPPAPVLNCSRPEQRRRFTILFEPLQSIPNSLNYLPGGTYYFMTTSTGRMDGITNLYQGACAERNMKLIIRVSYNPDHADFEAPIFEFEGYSVQPVRNIEQSSLVVDSGFLGDEPASPLAKEDSAHFNILSTNVNNRNEHQDQRNSLNLFMRQQKLGAKHQRIGSDTDEIIQQRHHLNDTAASRPSEHKVFQTAAALRDLLRNANARIQCLPLISHIFVSSSAAVMTFIITQREGYLF